MQEVKMNEQKKKVPFSFFKLLAWSVALFTAIIHSQSSNLFDGFFQVIGALLGIYTFSWILYFFVSRFFFFIIEDINRGKFKIIWFHIFMIVISLMAIIGKFL